MDKWFAATFEEIRGTALADFEERVVGRLTSAFSFRAITDEQRLAWRATARFLWGWTKAVSGANNWLAIMEYAPPLLTSRSDLLVVSHEHVVVIEMKTGVVATADRASARKQVLNYAEDLYWFHPCCRGVRIVPVVVAQDIKTNLAIKSEPDECPSRSWVLHGPPLSISDLLTTIASREPRGVQRDNNELWSRADYSPRPSIVDAAVALVAANQDRGVTAALADDEELERLTAVLVREVHEAAGLGDHRLLLVTGTPGSGKTLVGLRLAHDPTVVARLRDVGSQPLYLTGNGPLVDVITEALARDFHRRLGVKVDVARREAGVLVKLVHAFTREALEGTGNLSVPHVTVFDEGQRVWDSNRMGKKHKISGVSPSEPATILERLRKKPWAVVVVLVGEGQEINTGETGARLWVEAGVAPTDRGVASWQVLAPRQLAVAGRSIRVTDDLQLRRCRRSEGATSSVDTQIRPYVDS